MRDVTMWRMTKKNICSQYLLTANMLLDSQKTVIIKYSFRVEQNLKFLQ